MTNRTDNFDSNIDILTNYERTIKNKTNKKYGSHASNLSYACSVYLFIRKTLSLNGLVKLWIKND